VRRLLLPLAVAGAILAPATPAFAHGGDAPDATAYRTAVTAISAPAPGLQVRTVEAGARLELSNRTGHSVEILGYSGEPYLDVRPDGTYQNVNSPATYLNETLSGDSAVPPTADPTAPPLWRRLSHSTTVRWHDRRTHWLAAGLPPAAAADPDHAHRLRDWAVPLRTQVTTFEIRGTLDWRPPPRAWLWWAGAALLALTAAAAARRRPGPVALVGGLAPIGYGVLRGFDGGTVPLVLILAGLLSLAAVWRHPPFYLALSGAVLAVFGGLAEIGVLGAAVVPAAGPGWPARVAVIGALGIGAALTLTGVLRLRAALPAPAPVPAAA
jgi:hypothetical protein